jgi:dihydropteroate synthase
MLFHSSKPLLMGILNVTPDSFSDGGQFNTPETALRQAEKMLMEGADILDIGGESTRPYSLSVSSGEQIHRVIPIIRSIRSHLSSTIPISIDTRLSKVASLALAEGATLINDVSGGRDDPEILIVAARNKCPIILMHRKGPSETMQIDPQYTDVVSNVQSTLLENVQAALAAGINRDNIIIDPGIGFGKQTNDDLLLVKHLPDFVQTGYPVLIGTSRKQFIGTVLNIDLPTARIHATCATTALAVMAGARIIRVHDVKENRQALNLTWAIKTAQPPSHSALDHI